MTGDELLVTVANYVNPDMFKEEFLESTEDNYYKYEERVHIEILRRPDIKNCDANFAIRTFY